MNAGWRLGFLIAAAMIGAVVIYYGVFFRGQLPDHRWIVGYNDLVLHAGAFAALSLPLLLIWPFGRVFPTLAGLAAGLEAIQFWLPRRTPGWDDLAASVAGVLIGVGCVMLLRRIGRELRNTRGRIEA